MHPAIFSWLLIGCVGDLPAKDTVGTATGETGGEEVDTAGETDTGAEEVETAGETDTGAEEVDTAGETDTGAEEVDTAGETDTGVDEVDTASETDADGDGVVAGADCDDADPTVFPGAAERCDGVDDDCDGGVDEDDAIDAQTWFADKDGDGYGEEGETTVACAQPAGAVAVGGDCDDAAAAVNPEATEVCDDADVDEDCDGVADDADSAVDPATISVWYVDADGDGFGVTASLSVSCDGADGLVSLGGDCSDGDASIHPAAVEVCDDADVDEDCDGVADDADSAVDPATMSGWYVDADGDGFGFAASAFLACDAISGATARGDDCDDTNAAAWPGAPEACDGVDEDCDGAADETTAASCPDPGSMSLSEGGGLVAVDASGLVLADEDTWVANEAILDALATLVPTVSVGDVLADANRTATVIDASDLSRATGFERGFDWNSGDEDVTYWIPQGITGSFDADASGTVEGYDAVLVSWHYDPDEGGTSYDKGVRVSFVDVSSTGAVSYRHVLLVEPTGSATDPSFEAVEVHAGGLAWFGDLLYVADTSHGLRVFDLNRLMQVSTTSDEIGCHSDGTCYAYTYKYILPQVTRYSVPDCGCELTFSFVGLDRSSSPASLVTGEYDASEIDGLVERWSLDESTGLLAGDGYTGATESFVVEQDRMQGAASQDGEWWLSCSSQTSVYGELYNATSTGSTGYTWVDGPEDLAVDGPNGWIWSLTEDVGDRHVFAVNMADVGG